MRWKNEPVASATWEDLDSFTSRFLDFQLEDELILEGERDVMYGRTYNRTRRARDIRRRAERTARAGDGHEEGQESVTSRG